MNHTPGSWEYGIANNYEGFYIAPKGTLPTLAAVERCDHKSMTVSCFNFPGETEANARLIAATPDLLDSCKELRDGLAAAMRVMVHYEAATRYFEIELNKLGIPNGIGKRADTVIAKAEGRA